MAKAKKVYFTIPVCQIENMQATEILEVLRYDRAAPRGSVYNEIGGGFWIFEIDAIHYEVSSLPTVDRMVSFGVMPLVVGRDEHRVVDQTNLLLKRLSPDTLRSAYRLRSLGFPM